MRRMCFALLVSACALHAPRLEVIPLQRVVADAAHFDHQRITVQGRLVRTSVGTNLFAESCPISEGVDFVLDPSVLANSPAAARVLRRMVQDTPSRWHKNVQEVLVASARITVTGVFEHSPCAVPTPTGILDFREPCQTYRFIAESIQKIERVPDAETDRCPNDGQ